MQIVLINGEAQSGKSTLANHLANLLMSAGVIAETYSFVGPYRPMLASLFDYMYGEGSPVDYEDMKNEKLVEGLDFTGRDWMIQIGNASRNLHPYFLPAIFATYVQHHANVDVWIIENWGFADEYDFFKEEDVIERLGIDRVHKVSLTARSTRKYVSGEQYDGDNRYNLDAISDIVDPRVNELATMIHPGGSFPVDTIALQFGGAVEVHESPAPASELHENFESEVDEPIPHEVDGPDRDPHTGAAMEEAWARASSDGTNT